ncbi:helix-turn-helix transcriptional regulator [Actinomadura fulvescens]
MMSFGDQMRVLMERRGVSLHQLAKQTNYSIGHLSHVLNDQKRAGDDCVTALERALDAPGELNPLRRPIKSKGSRTGSVETDEEEMERRRLLQALAALGVTTSPALDALNSIQASVEQTIGDYRGDHLDEWEAIVEEYGYSYPSTTSDEMVRSLAADLVAVQQATARHAGTETYPSWCRVIGGLAALLAKTLSNLGQIRGSRTWWRTAQQAADRSGDMDLSLWVSGEWLVHGLYERRPVPLLLKQTDEVIARYPWVPGRGLVKVLAVRSQLLAAANPQAAAAAKEELARCTTVFELLPDSVTCDVRSIANWGEDRLRYTEAYVAAHLGDTDELERAVARTHQLLPACSPPWRVHVQTGLLQALGHVRAGDVETGINHARKHYERCYPELRTTMITNIAGKVLEAVPPQSITAPVVQEYRAMLLPGRQRREIT